LDTDPSSLRTFVLTGERGETAARSTVLLVTIGAGGLARDPAHLVGGAIETWDRLEALLAEG
jgi:hypothetical protein